MTLSPKGGTYFPFWVIFARVDSERRDNSKFREGITCVFERGWITNDFEVFSETSAIRC